MDIKQYLLIYLRVLVLQFCFRKDFYTPANICPALDNGHNIWSIQYDENYNYFMTRLRNHKCWMIYDQWHHTGKSKSTGRCYNALVSAFFHTGAEENANQQSLYF